jgi:hypothetical protein
MLCARPPARLLPGIPFPPYTYLPGRNPHPSRDPDGHLHAALPLDASFPGEAQWQAWAPYLFGVDLFNHGYYWEAHEAWETAWHACGRDGAVGRLLQGLIHLAGAGFATRRGREAGRVSHAREAIACFRAVEDAIAPGARLLGLAPDALAQMAETIATGAGLREFDTEAGVAVVFVEPLRPG